MFGNKNGTDGTSERNIHILAHHFLCGFHEFDIHALRQFGNLILLLRTGGKCNKFVTADPAERTALRQRLADNIGKTDQNLIAHFMAVKVVDQFKRIQVDHHKGTQAH